MYECMYVCMYNGALHNRARGKNCSACVLTHYALLPSPHSRTPEIYLRSRFWSSHIVEWISSLVTDYSDAVSVVHQSWRGETT